MASILDVQKALEQDSFYPDSIQADGRVHRFNRDSSDTKKRAWYCCFQNTSNKGEIFYVCTFSDWRDQEERKFISSFTQTKHDKKVIDSQLQEASRKRDQEQLKAWEETSKEVTESWGVFSGNGVSSYLTRKRVKPDPGVRFGSDALLVPVADHSGKLWGYQKIQDNGMKFFYPGTKKKGNFHAILSNDPSCYFFCEGYATGLSIHEATKRTVIVCFDAGNIASVCESFRNKHPETPFIICGDDDRFNETGNTGVSKAKEAAEKSLGKAIFPKFKSEKEGTDFNDLHCAEGIDTVRSQLEQIKPEKFYVKALGFNEGTYFYTSSSNPQISRIYSHDSTDLLKLMPREYWQALHPTKTGVDWETARSDLMERSRRKGFFLERNVRGLGIWEDRGKLVINLGDKIFYDGIEHHPHDIDSENFYTIGQRMAFLSEESMKLDECAHIVDFLKSISVRTDQQRIFLGGWVVISVLSGVLSWRPHLWITGEYSSGKSTVIRDFISRLQCGLVRRVAKNSTEAGIRQLVKNDAVPVLYDEFETKNKETRSRIEACMELICQASTDDSGQVIKGGADGQSQVYTPRFCAIVSSIRPPKRTNEEESRFTFIEMDKAQNSDAQWETVKKLLIKFDDDYCQRFVARTVRLYPVLKSNMATFRKVISKRYPHRIAQQYAPILGGYGLLLKDSPITEEEAGHLVDNATFDAPLAESDADYDDCLEHLLRKRVKCGEGEGAVIELINDFYIEPVAKDTLAMYGMSIVNGKRLFISKKNPELHRLFADSVWLGGWFESLSRMPGVERNSVQKIAGRTTRGIVIPIE